MHLPDPCDKAMTIHATDGPKESMTTIHDENQLHAPAMA